MRFLIKIENTIPQQVVANYQYPLSAWFYKVLNRADPVFADWLHNHGYAFNGNKKFKLFTFSGLRFENVQFKKTPVPHFFVPPGIHQWQLSFCMNDTAEAFIKGLFFDQQLFISEGKIKACFQIVSVERKTDPVFDTDSRFSCLSPVVLSEPIIRNGKMIARYMSPEEPKYSSILHHNTLKRFISANQNTIIGNLFTPEGNEILTNLPFNQSLWNFKIIGRSKSKLQTIKAGSSQETKIRGFLYEFVINAPLPLLSFIYAAGLGEKGSLGFGCVEMMNV